MLLRVEGLTTTFPMAGRRVPVVDGIEFVLGQGEVLALVGESGCGKSVTALSLLRLVPKPGRIEAGRVWLGERELLGLPVRELRRVRGGQISMIFQEPMTSLNPVVRVGDQVAEAIRLHHRASRRAALDQTIHLFQKVGISDPEQTARSYPHQLSGGMKQRVMIAMALSTQPEVLIADEPTTALDVTIQAQIVYLLRQLQHQSRVSILLITHDLGLVNELSDRVAVMYAGRLVEVGTREEVLARPRHPYTAALLNAMPARARRGQRLPEIPGTVPPAQAWPPGCRFSTRCARAFEPCPDLVPSRLELSPTHAVWCHAVEAEERKA